MRKWFFIGIFIPLIVYGQITKEGKFFYGKNSPYNPVDGVMWFNTDNVDSDPLKVYYNKKWHNVTNNKEVSNIQNYFNSINSDISSLYSTKVTSIISGSMPSGYLGDNWVDPARLKAYVFLGNRWREYLFSSDSSQVTNMISGLDPTQIGTGSVSILEFNQLDGLDTTMTIQTQILSRYDSTAVKDFVDHKIANECGSSGMILFSRSGTFTATTQGAVPGQGNSSALRGYVLPKNGYFWAISWNIEVTSVTTPGTLIPRGFVNASTYIPDTLMVSTNTIYSGYNNKTLSFSAGDVIGAQILWGTFVGTVTNFNIELWYKFDY